MPHGKGITLSIDQDRLLGAPVPTENKDMSSDMPEPEDQAIPDEEIEEGFDDSDIEAVAEGGENQRLIEMGVAFPKGATRPQSVSRRDKEDQNEERQREQNQNEEASRGIFI